MKNKSNTKLVSLGIIMFFIIAIFLIGFTIADNGTEDELKKKAEDYGKGEVEIDDLNEKKALLKNYADDYVRGVVSGDGDVDERMKKFTDMLLDESDDGIGDTAKEALIIAMVKLDKKGNGDRYMKLFANKALDKLRVDYGSNFPNDIEEFLITVNPENLVWRGSKLGVKGEDGEIKAWIDFKDIPAFTTKMGIIDNNGNQELWVLKKNGEYSLKMRWDSGGPDMFNYVRDMNGNKFGSNHWGIKSIRSEDGKFIIEYYGSKGALRQVSFDKGSIGVGGDDSEEGMGFLMDILGDEKFRQFYKAKFDRELPDVENLKDLYERMNGLNKRLNDLNKKLKDLPSSSDSERHPQIQQQIDNLKKDFDRLKKQADSSFENLVGRFSSFEMPEANLLQLGRLKPGEKSGEVFFSFNEDGGLEVSLEGGAMAHSTGVNGKANLAMRRIDGVDGKARFEYNAMGEIRLSNGYAEAVVYQPNLKQAFIATPKERTDEMYLDIRVVRSTLAHAIATNDVQKLLEYVEHRSRLLTNALIVQDPRHISASIEALEKQLGPDLELELASRIQTAVRELKGVLETQVEELVGNVFHDVTGVELDSVRADSNVEGAEDIIVKQTKRAVEQLLKEGNLQTMVDYFQDRDDEGKRNAANELIRGVLSDYIADYHRRISSSDVADIVMAKLGEGSTSKEDVEKQINDFIKSSVVLPGGSGEVEINPLEQAVRARSANTPISSLQSAFDARLRGLGINDQEQINAIWQASSSMIRDAVEGFEASTQDFEKRTMAYLIGAGKEDPNKDYLILDVDSGQVLYNGKHGAEVDVRMPASLVSVKADGEKFVLKSFGTILAEFEGDSTNVERDAGELKSVNIAKITNENIVDKEGNVIDNGYMVISNGLKYNIVDPTERDDVRKIVEQHGLLTVHTGIPFVGSVPITTHQFNYIRDITVGDPGSDEDAHFTFELTLEPQKGGFLHRVINWGAELMIDKEIATTDEEIEARISELRGNVDGFIDDYKEIIPVAAAGAQLGKDVLKVAEEQGVVLSDTHKGVVEDALRVAEIVGRGDGEGGLKGQVNEFLKWVSGNIKVEKGMSVQVWNNRLVFLDSKNRKIGEYPGFDPAIYRVMMREMDAWHQIIPNRFEATMEDLKNR